MPRIGSIIASAAAMGPAFAERLLKDISPKSFAAFARPGGVVVRSNHPAFILGHLSLYPVRVMQLLHLPEGQTAVPAGYDGLFKHGVECRDDPEATIHPPMAAMTAFFFASHKAAIDAVRAAPDAAFDALNPAEGRTRELFPTVGEAINFYVGGHVQQHLGQLSAWRRAMGMPAA